MIVVKAGIIGPVRNWPTAKAPLEGALTLVTSFMLSVGSRGFDERQFGAAGFVVGRQFGCVETRVRHRDHVQMAVFGIDGDAAGMFGAATERAGDFRAGGIEALEEAASESPGDAAALAA